MYNQNVNSFSPYDVTFSGFKSAINIRQMYVLYEPPESHFAMWKNFIATGGVNSFLFASLNLHCLYHFDNNKQATTWAPLWNRPRMISVHSASFNILIFLVFFFLESTSMIQDIRYMYISYIFLGIHTRPEHRSLALVPLHRKVV